MSIGTLSDRLVQRLVPKVDAGACLAPDPCDACGNPQARVCYNGRVGVMYYTLYVNDCNGRCTIYRKRMCKFTPTGGPC